MGKTVPVTIFSQTLVDLSPRQVSRQQAIDKVLSLFVTLTMGITREQQSLMLPTTPRIGLTEIITLRRLP